MEIIHSTTNQKVKFVRQLWLKKYRLEHKLFCVEGIGAVLSAFEAGHNIKQVLYCESALTHPAFAKFIGEFKGEKFAISEMIAEVLSNRDNPHQAFAILPPWNHHIENITPVILGNQCVLALDRIRDAGNLGTILRTHRANYGRHVILIDECVDHTSREVVRASMGNYFDMQFYLASSREFNYWVKDLPADVMVSATSSHGGVPFKQADYRKPHVLIMGNEQGGINPDIMVHARQQICIPINPQVESLNIAIATAILLFRF